MQPQLTAVTPRKLPVFVFPQNITFFLDDQSTHKQVLTLYNPYDFPVKFKVLCTAPNKYKVVDPEGTIKSRCCVDIVVRHTALMIANCNMIDKFRIQMQEHPTKQQMARSQINAGYRSKSILQNRLLVAKAIGKRDVEARLLNGTGDSAGRGTPDPEMFQQLPTNESRQQQSYAMLAQNRTIDKSTSKILTKSAVSRYNSIPEDMLGKSMNRLRQSRYRSAQYVVVDKGGTNYVALIAGIVCIIGLLLPTEGDQSHKVPDYLHLSINFKLIFSFVLGRYGYNHRLEAVIRRRPASRRIEL